MFKYIDLSDEINGILNKIIEDTPDTEHLWKEEQLKVRKNCKTLKESSLTDENYIQGISDVLSSMQVLTSKMCIIAGRNICQSLLEYSKSMYLTFLLFLVNIKMNNCYIMSTVLFKKKGRHIYIVT